MVFSGNALDSLQLSKIFGRQTWKNTQTCKPCLCNFFQICVNFFILTAISFVKARERLVQEKYINLDCVNFSFFSRSVGRVVPKYKIMYCNLTNKHSISGEPSTSVQIFKRIKQIMLSLACVSVYHTRFECGSKLIWLRNKSKGHWCYVAC